MRKNLAICYYYMTDSNDSYLYKISYCTKEDTQKEVDKLNSLNDGKHYYLDVIDSFY